MLRGVSHVRLVGHHTAATKCILVLAGKLMNLRRVLFACHSIPQAALTNSDKCVIFLPLAEY